VSGPADNTADLAIEQSRRQAALGQFVRVVLIVVTLIGPLAASALGARLGDPTSTILAWVVPLAIIAAWVAASSAGVRVMKLVQRVPLLIAAGRYDAAEHHLAQSLARFSMVRSSRVMALYHLATLRHAQGRHADAARLASAVVVDGRRDIDEPVDVHARLILAESSLELDRPHGAYAMLVELRDRPLRLGETLKLLAIEIEYLARIEGWSAMLERVGEKLELIDLMPAGESSRCQAWLALAASRAGQSDLHEYLAARVRLVSDPGPLVAARPVLRELFEPAASVEATVADPLEPATSDERPPAT
jgi:hypothetical protein